LLSTVNHIYFYQWGNFGRPLILTVTNNNNNKTDIYILPLTGKQNWSGLQIEVAYRIA